MKPTACILIYSGQLNPFKELSDAESETIMGLIGGLEIAFPGAAYDSLGFSGYAASFESIHVIASPYGHVRVYTDTGEKAYSDTTGILAYLCKIMTPVMVEHQQVAKKAWGDYVAGMFPYESNPWEPNF
jgi:hypothetical protein